MRRRSKTHVTYQLHFDLPEGVNTSHAQEFIKSALNCEANLRQDEFQELIDVNIPVSLVKKEVTYA